MTRLTPRALRVLQRAQEIAGELGQEAVGTEHLLLGLLAERDGIAYQVLAGLGIADETTTELRRLIASDEYRSGSNRVADRSGNPIGRIVRYSDDSIRVVDDEGRPLTGPLVRQPPPSVDIG
jgi:ATP-dependent Clp protease ATP-binding subunit ClpA